MAAPYNVFECPFTNKRMVLKMTEKQSLLSSSNFTVDSMCSW